MTTSSSVHREMKVLLPVPVIPITAMKISEGLGVNGPLKAVWCVKIGLATADSTRVDGVATALLIGGTEFFMLKQIVERSTTMKL